ncbi:flagellar protein FlgN [Halobacillus yeomjeoni]|uniref:flagellar protein FlgN n=1 Tax=Halobacillus yeomjeoni TaxID=311194 RepID=UPI001CD29EF3|nr:flagellar protein FlgN [Halobacillus yeomjeoni]MCA0984680.1 flagellar protein FlgN [Halobacillus yeomjeoni]
MTINTVVQHMNHLKKLHDSLLVLSKKKTDALKQNDVNGIQQLLIQERKHVQAISQVEKKREMAVSDWYRERGEIPLSATVSEMIEQLDGGEKAKLNEAYERLIFVLSELKKQEQLNSELTHQSLQFINLSLDLLQPSLNTVNYFNQTGTASDVQPKRSVFDSKA